MPNFKIKASTKGVRKLKGKEYCENEHRKTASFMYNFVQKTNIYYYIILLIFVDSPTGLESLIAGVSNNKEH